MSFVQDVVAKLKVAGFSFAVGSQYPSLQENEAWVHDSVDECGITTHDVDFMYWNDDIYMGPSLSQALCGVSITAASSVGQVRYVGIDPGSELHLWTAHKRWIE